MKMNRRSKIVGLTSLLFFVIMVMALARCGGGGGGNGSGAAPGIPTPAGLYASSSYSNNPAPDGSTALPVDLETNPTFLSNAIAGVAIYLALSELLPDPLPAQYSGMTWSQLFNQQSPAFNDWNWTYLDKTIATALRHNKLYSLGIVVGFQNAGSTQLAPQPADGYLHAAFPNAPKPFEVPSFEQSLPSWFEPLCNPRNTASYYPLPLAPGGNPPQGGTTSPWIPDSCAPTIDVWYPTQICLSFKVPIPWNPNVQMFWRTLANALSNHLRNTCYSDGKLGPCAGDQPTVYNYLTLVHLPGLSEFDEELSFMGPARSLPTSNVTCPDGRTATSNRSTGNDWATNAIAYDNSAYALVHDLGYREFPAANGNPATTNLIEGFETIAKSFINAFPDRVMGLSALNNVNGIDLPDLSNTFGPGGEFRKIAFDLAGFMGSIGSSASLELQSDDLADPFWNPNGPAANLALCSTPLCVDQSIPWVNPQHFFPGLNAIYGWQTDVGGVVQLASGAWTPIAQCMLAPATGPSPHCLDSTADSDINSSFYGLLKYAWQPVTVKGLPVQYLEIMPGDIMLRPKSIQKAVLENGWFAPR